ncbi:MAG: hypothetical protein L0H70_09025 [Xanthomonadales bacterium]|nr:hypothetical protein [Xanthomonadales bacterium]
MDSDGAVHIPSTPTHRLALRPGRWRARAARPYDDAAREYFHGLRWRQKPPQRVAAVLVLFGVLVLHILAFALLRQGSVPSFTPAPGAHESQAMQARLIEPPPTPNVVPIQLLPPAQVKAAPPQVRAARPVATPSQPMTATLEPTPMSTPPPKIYDRLGDIVLPDVSASAPSSATPAYRVPTMHGSDKLMHPHNPVEYTPTKMEKYFQPAGQDKLTKLVHKTTVEHTFTLPFGIHVKCAVAILAVAGGCAPVPPKQLSAPLRVKHKRDHFAPATPLIRQADKPAKSASVQAAQAASVQAAKAASVQAAKAASVAPAKAASVRVPLQQPLQLRH